MNHAATCIAGLAAVALHVGPAAADERGEFTQSDTLGMNVYTYNFSASKTTTVSDAQNLAEFVGLHYYFVDHWRIGMNLQFTEQLAPTPAAEASRFRTFALLPQIGWNFYKPFFAALVLTLAPRTGGEEKFDAGFQGVFGASFELTPRVRANVAVEIPVNFVVATTIGITPLLGISIKL